MADKRDSVAFLSPSPLFPGDLLDGDTIIVRELQPYPHAFTYDILPASSTGTYVADGLLIGSTLK